MHQRIAPCLLVVLLGCGGKTTPAPVSDEATIPDEEEEVVAQTAPPDAAPEPPPPPDPWADDLRGDDFSSPAPAPWAAVMRPNAAWSLRDVAETDEVVRITVEKVTKEKIGHVVVLKWESRESWPEDEDEGGATEGDDEGEDGEDGEDGEEVEEDPFAGWEGAPRRIAVSSKGVWWSDKASGAFPKKPTFSPKVVKANTQGTVLCLEAPVCEEECGVLCVDSASGIVGGHGGEWPGTGYFQSSAWVDQDPPEE